MSIGQRITIIRGKLSRRKFASHIGVNQSSVQRWELENQIPKGDVLKRLASDFNVDLNWLLTGEGEGPFKRSRELIGEIPGFSKGKRRQGSGDSDGPWSHSACEKTDDDEYAITTHEPGTVKESRAGDSEKGFDHVLEQEFSDLVIDFIREVLADPKGAKWFKRLFVRYFPEFTDWLIARKLEK